MSNPLPIRKPLPTRNVFVRNPEGIILCAFWQYGFVDWKTFYTWLRTLFSFEVSWAVFDWNEAESSHGQIKVEDTSLVDPGWYTLLQSDGTSLTGTYGISAYEPKIRHPTPPNSAKETVRYRERVRVRDAKCLITEIPFAGCDYLRFEATHIFSRGREKDWISDGYPDRITDPAPLEELGGPSKIDSIQNMILLRSDLRIAWDNYMFGVNPDAGYVVTPFVNGYADIAGKTLKLDHITNLNIRPLDDLFRDHLFQGVLKNMKGSGEPWWNYKAALEDGLDLSRIDIWGTEEGKQYLELALLVRFRDLELEGELELL